MIDSKELIEFLHSEANEQRYTTYGDINITLKYQHKALLLQRAANHITLLEARLKDCTNSLSTLSLQRIEARERYIILDSENQRLKQSLQAKVQEVRDLEAELAKQTI